jgi:hypothetical protein
VEALAGFDSEWTLDLQTAWVGAYETIVKQMSVEPSDDQMHSESESL